MKSPLVSAMQTHDTTTANGALSHSTTGSAIVDFFGKGASLRNSSEQDALRYFAAAFQENPTVAIKVLFYLGDIRGGQGERRLFRLCLRWLATNHANFAQKIVALIPTYRRWDDVLESLDATPLEGLALKTLASQLEEDYHALVNNWKDYKFSLAAKWAPSEQASSKRTRQLASMVRHSMGHTPREYRKALSALRKRLDVVERKMSVREWGAINYPAVPSNASKLYKKAFDRHDHERYSAFLTKVERGDEKVNAATLYPYDIVREIEEVDGNAARLLEAQWKAQPDYLKDNPHCGLVLADVSGSMTTAKRGNVRPIDVSVSLAIYFAERNVGPFRDYFLTFTDQAKLEQLIGTTLKQKMAHLHTNTWCGSTNLQSAFESILSAGVRSKIAEADMPKVIYIVSDMQFNEAVSDNSLTNLEAIRLKYERAGYKMPRIVFWCVNAYGDTPVKVDDKGVCLVSGCSPSILKTVLNGDVMTPMDVVLHAVNVERYSAVEAALKHG